MAWRRPGDKPWSEPTMVNLLMHISITWPQWINIYIYTYNSATLKPWILPEMCSERDSPLEPFVLPAPGQPELARLICGAHLGPPVLTRKQKRPRVNSLVCDRAAAFCAAGPPEVLSRMSRPVTQAAERERELARARSQQLNQAAPSLPGESVSRGFADRGALEGYPSHYTSLILPSICKHIYNPNHVDQQPSTTNTQWYFIILGMFLGLCKQNLTPFVTFLLHQPSNMKVGFIEHPRNNVLEKYVIISGHVCNK